MLHFSKVLVIYECIYSVIKHGATVPCGFTGAFYMLSKTSRLP